MFRLILACGFAILTARTQALPELQMGSKAPDFVVEQWLKGPEIASFEPGHVYVLEFWATWCGPCVQSIPHLNALQDEYGDRITVIGLAASEQGSFEDQLAELRTFMSSTSMEYRVAIDSTGKMKEKWLTASAAPGIPRAMVVDGAGTILFIGHPLDLDNPEIGNPLAQIMNGTWEDSGNYKKYMERENLSFEAAEQATSLLTQLEEAKGRRDWKEMIRVAGEGIALNNPRTDNQFYDYLIEGFILDGQHQRGQDLIGKIINENFNHPQYLASMLEMIIHPGIPSDKWDLSLGDKTAERAVDLIENNSDPHLHEKFQRYLWVLLPPVAAYYAKTNRPRLAIPLQTRALGTVGSDDDQNRTELEDELKAYEAQAGAVECAGGVCQTSAIPVVDPCMRMLK